MSTSARPGPEDGNEATEPAGQRADIGGDVEPPRSGGPPRPALIGLGVIAAIVAITLAVILLQPPPDPVGEANPSTTTSGNPQATEAPAPSTTADATSEPTAAAAPEITGSWTEAAVFSEPGKRYVLGDLVAWSGGFVAVGTLYEEEGRAVFGPPPPRAGSVWRSTNGSEWTDATPDGTFADVELTHLFETADGALIVVGTAYAELDAVSAVWETIDGATWTPIELTGVPEDAFMYEVASGPQGHVAGVSVGGEPHPLRSADGRMWEPILPGASVNSPAAGDEGFVVSASRTKPEGTISQILASADGLEWFDATVPWDGAFLAAPRGEDWVATTTVFTTHGEPAADVTTWQSANGLDWSSLGTMNLASVEVDGGGPCLESPGALHGLTAMVVAGTLLSGPCSEGAVIAGGGSYASLDGAEWTRLPFGDQAFAAGAAILGDRVVIGTDARTNQADVMGVTFWISEAP